MTFSKTFFAIALFLCFLSVKTNAQVGLTMNHVKKSVMFRPQNNPLRIKQPQLNLPKISYTENPYYQRQGDNNAASDGDIIGAIFDKRSSVLERIIGTTLFIWGNVVK
jgi:hypothetical protein